ncbi:cysteine-rich CWC family protein [Cognaticolwellia aestuarii]|uniref:cysteine-rich CWC family protein n=1 Tax=Cognaticolwellia aestuarii TaxID=329993 RepID=UPI000ADB7409|nr:cysteine-rich CWC family protein [Cognaticolwellia aestuarii]
MTTVINDSICPLCQANNFCGIKSTEPCWCVESDIQPGLLKQVPAELSRKSCICQKCIDKFNSIEIIDKS